MDSNGRTPSSGQRQVRDAVLLIALSYICFVNTFRLPFIDYDDEGGIRRNPHVQGLSSKNLRHIFSLPQTGDWRRAYLPVRDLSLAADYSLWRWRSRKDRRVEWQLHTTNVVLHILNVLLLYQILLRFRFDPNLAILAAAIFACHPIHVESVTWISGRKDVLSGFFFFSAILAYIWSSRQKEDVAQGNQLATLLLYTLATFTKATSIILPGILILIDLFILTPSEQTSQNLRDRIRHYWKRWIPFIILAAVLAGIHIGIALRMGTVHPGVVVSTPSSLLRFFPITGHYFWKFFFPIHLSLRYPAHLPFLSLQTVSAWLALAGLAWFAVRTPSIQIGWRTVFGLGWCFICLLPVFNLLPTSTLVADRYFYLPSAGASLLLGMLLTRLSSNRVFAGAPVTWLPAPITITLIVCLSAYTLGRNTLWEDPLKLWKDSLRTSPNDPVALYNLSHNYLELWKNREAISLLERASRMLPNSPDIRNNLALVSFRRGKISEAEKLLQDILDKSPDDFHARLNMGYIHIENGEHDKAAELIGKLQKERPESLQPRLGVALIYERKKIHGSAIADLEKLRGRYPNSPDLHKALSRNYLATDRPTQAAETIRRAINLSPRRSDLHHHLAQVLTALGHQSEAEEARMRAAILNPDLSIP